MRLNNHVQAAIQADVDPFPFDGTGEFDGASSILFWQNGVHFAVVGPGDEIPGGRVPGNVRLLGLSDRGEVLFATAVTDGRGATRDGIFIAEARG